MLRTLSRPCRGNSMNNTAAIKSRMKSIRQTVQISNAQKLIAASRIGKAKKNLYEAEPYHNRIRETIAGVLELCPDVVSRFLERSASKEPKRGMLVITSDRGLAGGYNGNVVKLASDSMAQSPAERVVVLGNVGRSQLAGRGFDLYPDLGISTCPPTMFAAREIAEKVISLFEAGEVDSFDLLYTHYTSGVRLDPKLVRMFPLSPEVFGAPPGRLKQIEFEPSAESVLSMLIPKYLKGFIYGCLVHSWASELASRLSAMDSAIRNGNEMLEKLSLIYNRARQAAITQEITEIVAGATAMQQ